MYNSVTIGIIGIGRWGTNHLRTLNEFKDVRIKWICSTRKSTLLEALNNIKTNDGIRTTTDYRDILNDKDIDAVTIATPGSTHYQLTKESLESNKNVLVEKPLAFKLSQAEELVALSKKKEKILVAGDIHRYNPGIQKIKEDIGKGIFGKIKYIESFGSGNGPIRNDMNALWDYFPHDVSIMEFLLGQLPLRVSVNGADYIKKNVEDIVTMDLYFPNHVFGYSVGTWLYPIKKRNLVVVGERMSATFDDYAENEKLKYYNPNFKSSDNKNTLKSNDYTSPEISNAMPLTRQLRHFIDCIQNKSSQYIDSLEGLKVVRVLEAAQKSLENDGKMIKITESS